MRIACQILSKARSTMSAAVFSNKYAFSSGGDDSNFGDLDFSLPSPKEAASSDTLSLVCSHSCCVGSEEGGIAEAFEEPVEVRQVREMSENSQRVLTKGNPDDSSCCKDRFREVWNTEGLQC